MRLLLSKKSLATVLLGFYIAGCASPGVNPTRPGRNVGYVDFYAEPQDDLSWDITSLEEEEKELRIISSNLKSPENGVLRLALAPGMHMLRVAFLDRVVTHPAEIEVQVVDGSVTPVKVNLTQSGTAVVESKERTYGPTAYGRYGRRSEVQTEQAVAHVVSAIPEASILFAPKAQMPYAH